MQTNKETANEDVQDGWCQKRAKQCVSLRDGGTDFNVERMFRWVSVWEPASLAYYVATMYVSAIIVHLKIPLTSQTTLSGTSEDLVSPELDFVTSDPNGSEATAIDGEDATMLCSKASPGCQCFRETHLLTHPV